MANISHLAGSSSCKFRALNKGSDIWGALCYQPQSMGHANASCLSKSGHLSLKYTVNIQPLLLVFSFLSGKVGLMGDTCLHRVHQGVISLHQICVPVLQTVLLIEGPHASAKNDRHPWGLAESSARNRHGHLPQGNTFLGTYMKIVIALLLGKSLIDFSWNITSV